MRVCSHDRAGHGWSAARERDWSAAVAADELDQLLTAAGETGPWLLVAHSIGALVARNYALRHPEKVGGLVLIDPTDTAAAQRAIVTHVAIAQSRVARTLSQLGVLRAAGHRLVPALVGAQSSAVLMEQLPAAYPARSFAASVQVLQRSAGAAAALDRAEEAERTVYGGGTPLTITSSGEADAETLTAHRSLTAMSPEGRHLQAPSGGHYVHDEHPGLVVRAILDT